MQSSSMLDKMQAVNTFLICEGVKRDVICCQYIWHIQQTKYKEYGFFLLYTKRECGRRRRVAFYSHLFHTYIILQFFYYLLRLIHSLSHSYLTPSNAWNRSGMRQRKNLTTLVAFHSSQVHISSAYETIPTLAYLHISPTYLYKHNMHSCMRETVSLLCSNLASFKGFVINILHRIIWSL
jgi:hypothetical protein